MLIRLRVPRKFARDQQGKLEESGKKVIRCQRFNALLVHGFVVRIRIFLAFSG